MSSRLPLCSSRQVVAALRHAGAKKARKSTGSHQSYVRIDADGRQHTATVPLGKKEIPIGTLRSIIEQAGLTEEQFVHCLRKKLK